MFFCFHVSQHLDDDCDPTTIVEARSRSDWPMWEEAMRSKLESLISREVFSPVETMPKKINPVCCKWMFVRKLDKFRNVSQYKAWLVAQDFTQRPSIDY